MKTHEQFIKQTEEKKETYTKNSTFLLISVIPFMIFEILTHKLVFLEFSIILFLGAVYFIKQLINLNKRLELIKETQIKLQKTNIKKIYPEGHHVIANPNKAVLQLGAYAYVGTDNHGLKIYQNTTEIIVCGSINPTNGEVIYDEYGVPAYLINNQK